jgi:hypothetical protein
MQTRDYSCLSPVSEDCAGGERQMLVLAFKACPQCREITLDVSRPWLTRNVSGEVEVADQQAVMHDLIVTLNDVKAMRAALNPPAGVGSTSPTA